MAWHRALRIAAPVSLFAGLAACTGPLPASAQTPPTTVVLIMSLTLYLG